MVLRSSLPRAPAGRSPRLPVSETISETIAETLLLHELHHTYLPGVLRQCPILLTDERKCNAIVDFVYNLGLGRLQTSTLKRKINDQDWDAAQEQLMLWTKGGGKVLPGLVKRRAAEAVYLTTSAS